MHTEEKITSRIWSDSEFKPALLIGGLLFYLPIVNLLLLGYAVVFLKSLIANEGLSVPKWKDGQNILRETVFALPVALLYIAVPLLLAGVLYWSLHGIFSLLYVDLLAYTVAWIPFSIVAAIVPVLFFNGLYLHCRHPGTNRWLQIYDVLRKSIQQGPHWIRLILLFWGLVLLGWPLIGFAFFAALLPFLASAFAIIKSSSKSKPKAA